MEGSLLRFVWRQSWRDQLVVLALAFCVLPFTWIALELPKMIVNGAIGGGEGPRTLGPFTLDRVSYLMALSAALLAAVGVSNALKWNLNTRIGRTGEKLLRALRAEFFARVMRFPAARFRRERAGDLVQRMLGEVEPMGGFMGGLIAEPAFQAGQLMVFAGFVFVQSPWLGLAAVAMFPVQAWLIPRLQAEVVRLNRRRSTGTRRFAEFVSESVEMIGDTRVNGASGWRVAEAAERLRLVGEVRIKLFKRKYLVKGLNNVLNQLSPVFFYAFGGWMVIEGSLELGALVAVVAAQREMATPWKALLTFVQQCYDFGSRFAFAWAAFAGDDLLPAEKLAASPAAPRMAGALDLAVADAGPEAAGLRLSGLTVPPGARVAILGGEDGAATALARIAAGLAEPGAGRATLGGASLAAASFPALGAAIGHVPAEPALMDGSVEDNMAFGLFRAEVRGPDLTAAGLSDRAALRDRLVALAEAFDLATELRRLGLARRPPAEAAADWAALLPVARAALAEALGAEALEDLVEPWRRDSLSAEASLAENLLFCAPPKPAAVPGLLRAAGAEPLLIEIGRDLAREFRGLVEASGGEAALLDGLEGWRRGDILAAAEIGEQRGWLPGWAQGAERRQLIDLALRFTPARDRIAALDAGRVAAVLALRPKLLAKLTAAGAAPFDAVAADPARPLVDSLLAGRVRRARRGAAGRLDAVIDGAIAAAGVGPALARLGLGAPAPRDGMGLTARRRLALVRAVVKRPSALVLERGFGRAADAPLRARIGCEAPGATLIWIAEEQAGAADADIVVRIAPDGEARATLRGEEDA